MALVIFFVPESDQGIAEMARVVRPGGTVAAYVWDMMGGGHPLELMRAEMHAMGFTAPRPPRSDVSGVEALRRMWMSAGLDAIGVGEIAVQRTFADFEDFWTTSTTAVTVSQIITAMAPRDAELLKMRMRARLPMDAGRITQGARANAIKGRVPSNLAKVTSAQGPFAAEADQRDLGRPVASKRYSLSPEGATQFQFCARRLPRRAKIGAKSPALKSRFRERNQSDLGFQSWP